MTTNKPAIVMQTDFTKIFPYVLCRSSDDGRPGIKSV